MSLFSFLFPDPKRSKESDSWSQTQREALVDLLYYAIYADNHLSNLEEHRVREELDKVHWESADSLDYAINRAIKRARDARNDASVKESHLAFIKERLGDEAAFSKAAALCEEVLRSDGIADRELSFLKEVRQSFGL